MEAIFVGGGFLVKTDHNKLKYFSNLENSLSKTTKMGEQDPSFLFRNLYKKGKENVVVANLSRKHDSDDA